VGWGHCRSGLFLFDNRGGQNHVAALIIVKPMLAWLSKCLAVVQIILNRAALLRNYMVNIDALIFP
jgi:hypothetical protein